MTERVKVNIILHSFAIIAVNKEGETHASN